MSSLSLCMIVKNEQDFLKTCLEQTKNGVDEVIIVDTGSTDSTKEIAKSFGATVIHYKWTDDFSKARNVSLKHATKDWILVIDADEIIAKEDLAKIKGLIKENRCDAIRIVQRNYTNNSSDLNWQPYENDYTLNIPFTGFYPIKITRIFKNDKRIYYKDAVHEQVDESIKEFNGKTIQTGIVIHHLQHLKGENFHKNKQLKYLELSKKKLNKKKSYKTYYDIGLINYKFNKNIKEAIKNFKKAIELNPSFIDAYIDLGSVYSKQNELDKAVQIYAKALEIDPKNVNICNNIGNILLKQKKYQEAVKVYQNSIKLNPKKADTYYNIGNILVKFNKLEEAIKFYKKAIELNPKNSVFYNNLGNVFIIKKDFKNGIECLEKAIQLEHPNKEKLKKLVKEIRKDLFS